MEVLNENASRMSSPGASRSLRDTRETRFTTNGSNNNNDILGDPNGNTRRDSALSSISVLQATPNQIPIVGYEVMEERARFTIYKLRIDDPRTGLSWMLFRRYTDFVRLHSRLKSAYPNMMLPLPEKRRFRNNFEPSFLEERVKGLQLFVNTVMKRLAHDKNVREFFCLDEPPPVGGDVEPETQGLLGALEDTVGTLRNQLRQNEDTIKYLKQKVFYLEEKMKACSQCNPEGVVKTPDSGSSSTGS